MMEGLVKSRVDQMSTLTTKMTESQIQVSSLAAQVAKLNQRGNSLSTPAADGAQPAKQYNWSNIGEQRHPPGASGETRCYASEVLVITLEITQVSRLETTKSARRDRCGNECSSSPQ